MPQNSVHWIRYFVPGATDGTVKAKWFTRSGMASIGRRELRNVERVHDIGSGDVDLDLGARCGP